MSEQIDRDKIEWKKDFIERFEKLTNIDEFKKYSLTFLRRCIRVNTLKCSVSDMKKILDKNGWKYEQIPWCKEGFYVNNPDRRDIGNITEHALGYFYVQEAASMIPPIVLNPNPGDIVLDMCAAPGSKSTQIASMIENKGLLVSNDSDASRINALILNLGRCGVTCSIVTNQTGERFRGLMFDKILLDAPCSGIGTIRKSLKTIRMWNPRMATKIAKTQKELILTAWEMLKPNGILVYSTCTLEPEENEGVIDYLIKNRDNVEVLPIELDIKRSEPVMEFEGAIYDKQIKNVLRIWPQDNDTEGFFVAKIRKNLRTK
ncbi:MAG: RsmB/NOP family class I SAM-dependent RNA methyltransferase [Candidatus Woesearchaeota archaeon]|jgi:NOL1/NOP2/sun family putative RNA methylase